MSSKYSDKKQKSVKELVKALNGDGIKAEISEIGISGKQGRGDINISFKGIKYPAAVSRKQNLPTETLDKEAQTVKADILLMRKDRKSWKVFMDLETLQMLLLNNRS